MNHFVVYHNPDTMGYDAREVEGFAIVTKKSVMGAKGSRIWLITGRGSPRRYSITHSFIAQTAGPSSSTRGMNEVAAEEGTRYRPEIELTELPWFPAFKKTMGSFGLGYQRIKEPYISALETLHADFGARKSKRAAS
jgi:hypothetical protein